MEIDYFYAYEKFSDAVAMMATSTGSLRQRLAKSTGCLVPLIGHRVPDVISRRFKKFIEDMTSKSETRPGIGAIHSTTEYMNYHKAKRLADELVAMYFIVSRIHLKE